MFHSFDGDYKTLNMIPKTIHYCWLSDEPLPIEFQQYIAGWKKVMPEYKIKKWDKKAFDIHSVKWVADAYAQKKWAFCADYIRAFALYTEGGFYLDSDVIVNKRFDKYLSYGFVSSLEYNHTFKNQLKVSITSDYKRIDKVDRVPGLGIQAAIIGSEKGHPFPKELLEYYHSHQFVSESGILDQTAAPVIYAWLLEKRGLKYLDRKQLLEDNICLFDSSVFASYPTCTFNSVAIHMMAGSWVDVKSDDTVIRRIKKTLLVRKMCNLLHLY